MVLILIEVERVNFLLLKRSFIMRIAQEMLVSTILSTRERVCVCLEGSSYYGRVELNHDHEQPRTESISTRLRDSKK